MTEQMKLPHDHHGDASLEAHLIEALHAAGDFSMAANVFKQLSDSSRLRIFWLLCHCEQCVVNISSMVELRLSGLIKSRRVGKEVYYHAADSDESRLLHQVIEEIIVVSCPK